jgi:hypothetical protein
VPPRLIVTAIIIFWLGATAWLFRRDIWPHLRPNEPPPYAIDLADEARQHALPIHWTVFHGDTSIGDVQTSVRYRAIDDTFDMQSKVSRAELKLGPLQVTANPLTSTYRVTRAGELRELLIEGDFALQMAGLDPKKGMSAKLNLEGKVDGGLFVPKGDLEFANIKENLPLEPVAVSSSGSILNPLHPVNRIVGLRRGQHWQVPLVDPLADSVTAMVQKYPGLDLLVNRTPRVRSLQAEVKGDFTILQWHDREVNCLLIEYRQDDFVAHTWVRASDGLVLQQEASLWKEKVILQRD